MGAADTGSVGRSAWGTLAILTLVNTVNYMDRNVINILLPRIKDHLVLSDTALGLIGGAAFTIFYAVAALPIGLAVDRLERRLVLAAGLVVWSASTFLSGAAPAFPQIFAARAMTGSGEATAHPAGVSLISDLFPARRRAVAIAVFQAGVAIGGGLGVLVGGHVAGRFDWRVTLMIFSFAGAIVVPLVMLLPEPRRAAAAGVAAHAGPGWSRTVRRLLGVPTLAFHYAATVFVMFALQGYAVWMPSFLERERGFDRTDVTNLAGMATLVGGVVGGLMGGILADRLYARDRRGRLALQSAAALLAAPPMIATVLVPSRPVIVAGLFAAMILLVTMFPILSAVVVDLTHPRERGTGMAILLVVQTGIGFSLGPLAVGRISDLTGSLAAGLVFPAASLLVVVALGVAAACTVRRDLARMGADLAGRAS